MAEPNLVWTDLLGRVNNAMGSSQSKLLGDSFISQMRQANAGIGALKGVSGSEADQLTSGLKGMRTQAAVGAGLAGMQGLAGIFSSASQGASINDTSQIQGQIDDTARQGNGNYSSVEQLAADWNSRQGVDINYDDIRGMGGKGVTGEKLMNVGSSTLQGVSAGMQVGGPIGAAVGGVIGLGASIGGILFGDQKARIKQASLQAKADSATRISDTNFQAAQEELSDRTFRSGMKNIAATGGVIRRKIVSGPAAYTLVRKHCKGGTMIRFNRK